MKRVTPSVTNPVDSFPSVIFDTVILANIFKFIEDSTTWCNFSQVSRKTRWLGKLLIVTKCTVADGIQRIWTELPNGTAHGSFELYDLQDGSRHAILYRKDGNIHGSARQWYTNGQLMYISHFNNGKPAGVNRGWRENGELLFDRMY